LNLNNVPAEDVERQRRTVRAILARLYSRNSVPGVILADEVGMGKTYVALSVAATIFKNSKGTPKVIVLAPSNQMKEVWANRWDTLRGHQRTRRLPSGKFISTLRKAAPGISFGSYPELKHTTASEVRAAFITVSTGRDKPRKYRRKLLKQLFESQKISKLPKPASLIKLPKGKIDAFWRANYDKDRKTWFNAARTYDSLKELIYQSRRARNSIADLIIIDEAHKLAGKQSQAFLKAALFGRTRHVLYVTATPFSLTLHELLNRITELFETTGARKKDEINALRQLLDRFSDIVHSRDDLTSNLKTQIEATLGKFLIRSRWPQMWDNNVSRRSSHELKVPRDYLVYDPQAFAMFALERKFVMMNYEGTRTYIAAHRETLCSSFAAIEDANERNPYFGDVVKLIPKSHETPKLEYSVKLIEGIVRGQPNQHQKVVVFCSRNATIRQLTLRLGKSFAKEQKKASERWTAIRKILLRRGWTKRSQVDWAKARLAAYIFNDFSVEQVDDFIKRLELQTESSGGEWERPYLERTWGTRHHVNWVSTITGERSHTGPSERSNEEVQYAFNLQGPPYVLLCSEKARESIDLHRWCRHIVHYDLDWNPSVMEQRVGRIDRIKSLAARTKSPIEIYYFRVGGTYEERIFRAVKERMDMTRVLLGGGDWLADDDSPRLLFENDLTKYKLNFEPTDQKAGARAGQSRLAKKYEQY
jgi:superfamily II DNA or RNA helicase